MCGYLFIEMADATQIPVFAEPWFLSFNYFPNRSTARSMPGEALARSSGVITGCSSIWALPLAAVVGEVNRFGLLFGPLSLRM